MHALLIPNSSNSATSYTSATRAARSTPAESAALDTTAADGRLLRRILDVVDYGMVLVQGDGRAAFANKAALNDLDPTHPLSLADGVLLARHPRDVLPLREALASALNKGLQRLLTLQDERGGSVCIAIVPIGEPTGPGRSGTHSALLMLSKRKVCDDLSAEAFGRQHKLTLAEARVLKQLCSGHRPAEIARHQGVALSTVRTQIGCMREKTGASSIGALVSELSRLPPMLNLLREAA